MSKSSDQRGTVVLLEFMETTSIQYSREYSVHIKWLFVVNGNDSIEIFLRVEWLFRLSQGLGVLCVRIRKAEVLND